MVVHASSLNIILEYEDPWTAVKNSRAARLSEAQAESPELH